MPSTRTKGRARPRRFRLRRFLSAQSHDLIALLALVGCGSLLLIYAALAPGGREASTVARPSGGAAFVGFYGLERNTAGEYRWSKPDATIVQPVAAPARYRITLTLADSASAPPQRPVTISLNDRPVGTFTLDERPREYIVEGNLDALRWAGGDERALKIQLHTAPFVPTSDPRSLGVIIAAVTVEPSGRNVDWLALLGPLALLVGVYIALRSAGLPWRPTTTIGATALVAFTALALANRELALFLAYQPFSRPNLAFLIILGLLAAPLITRTVRRGDSLATPDTVVLASEVHGDRRSRVFWALSPLLVTVLAGGLRLYRYDRASLWLDEAATVHFSRLDWVDVLGLRGWYDYHPPLYYILAKLAALAVPLADAGRLVSVVTGTLTVTVAYAMVARFLDRRAAFLAALALALSPLHIWYSQTARMYVPAMLFVALSYWALLAYAQTTGAAARRWWLLAYALATLLALYCVYSVIYALLPQGLLLILVARKDRRRARELALAVALVVIGYLPWLPQMVNATRAIIDDSAVTSGRGAYLGLSTERVANSLLSILGIGGDFGNFAGERPRPWERWPTWQGVFLVLIVLIALLGGTILARRTRLGFATTLGLLVGTIVVGIAVSLVSPGYAERTVIFAVLGWAILVGAMGGALTGGHPLWIRLVAVVCLGWSLIIPNFSLAANWRGANPPDYRGIVADIATVYRFGQPVYPVSSWMGDFVAAYAPDLQPRPVEDDTARKPFVARPAENPTGVWLAYADDAWDREHIGGARARLAEQGYVRVLHKFYGRNLYLDLYLLPLAEPGAPIAINGGFAAPAGDPTAALNDWRLPDSGARFQPDQGNGRSLLLQNDGRVGRQATLDVPLTDTRQQLLVLRFDARTQLRAGTFGPALTCLSADGTPRDLPSTEGGGAVSEDGRWRDGRIAILCPPATAKLRVALGNNGTGDVGFRRLALSAIAVPPAPGTAR